jgi:hypothetical protein
LFSAILHSHRIASHRIASHRIASHRISSRAPLVFLVAVDSAHWFASRQQHRLFVRRAHQHVRLRHRAHRRQGARRPPHHSAHDVRLAKDVEEPQRRATQVDVRQSHLHALRANRLVGTPTLPATSFLSPAARHRRLLNALAALAHMDRAAQTRATRPCTQSQRRRWRITTVSSPLLRSTLVLTGVCVCVCVCARACVCVRSVCVCVCVCVCVRACAVCVCVCV